MSFDFFALNWTFHLCAQSEIFTKSLLSCAAVSAGSVPVAKSEVSSAKINISLSMSSIMSSLSMSSIMSHQIRWTCPRDILLIRSLYQNDLFY